MSNIRICLLLVAATLSSVGIHAASQPPVPCEWARQSGAPNHSENCNQVAQKSVVPSLGASSEKDAPIRQLQSTNNQQQRLNPASNKYRTWVSDPNWVIAALTFGLIIVGAAQAWTSLAQWRTTGRQIALSREAFIASHRPRIILRNVVRIKEGELKLLYELVNTGGSKATVVKSWVTLEFCDPAEVRNLRCDKHTDLGTALFEAGQLREFTCPVDYDLRWPMYMEGQGQRPGRDPVGRLYFAGCLTYQDESGNIRRTVFRRIFDHESKSFVRTSNPDHEYAD